MLGAIGRGAIENRRHQQALAGTRGIQRGDGVRIGQKRAGRDGQFLRFRFAIARDTAAIGTQFGLSRDAAADRTLGYLRQAEAKRSAIHGFQRRIIGPGFKLRAFAVTQRHGEALTRGPAFACVNQFIEHGAGNLDNPGILPRTIQPEVVNAAMGGECACREWRKRRASRRILRPLGKARGGGQQ